jgi:membrane protein YdbS with pleckstrin-like domain
VRRAETGKGKEENMRELPTGRLNKRVKSVWRLSGVIKTVVWGALCFGAALGAAAVFRDELNGADGAFLSGGAQVLLTIAGVVTALIFIISVIITPVIRYARWRYAVLEDEIDIYRGIIVRKRIIVPLIRVQYTDTTQGPLLRAFGLASVKVYTAAGAQDIEGLAVDDAEQLRDKVAVLAKQVQEDV